MTITLDPEKKLSEVQKEFNFTFPYLKLEFFKHKHGLNESNSKKDRLNPELTLKKAGLVKNQKAVIVEENMLVMDLEQIFQNVFGISVQVFRKSGRSWLETRITDNWTLKHQNDEGKELSYMSK